MDYSISDYILNRLVNKNLLERLQLTNCVNSVFEIKKAVAKNFKHFLTEKYMTSQVSETM